MKKLLCLMVVAISLSGRQSASSSKSTVDAYLEALKKGEPQKQQELSCHQKQPLKSEEPLVNVQKWEIVDQEPKTSDSDSDGKYELVSAKVETKAIGDFTVTRTWKFSVWRSDDLFESNKRTFDKANRSLADIASAVGEMQRALGEKSIDAPPKPVVADRKEYSPKPYCITRFGSES